MKKHTALAASLALALTVGLAACGDDDADDTSGGSSAAELTISGVWARTSPMLATRGAVYMEIDNPTDADDALVDASVDSSIAAKAEIHETVTDSEGTGSTMGSGEPDNPMMGMREVDQIDVAAGETTTLEPGGYHVMLIDLASPLEVGTSIDVTLEFETAGTKVVTAEVRDSEM